MKQTMLISIKLSLIMLVLCCVFYFGIISLAGTVTPGAGEGKKLVVKGKVVGYENVGQRFTEDRYFQSRPSAVDYNSAGSGGSNKGPSNPAYLATVKDRIDSFMAHNPGIAKADIPVELVTASGSGLDPHLSPAAAAVQVKRIAAIRRQNEKVLQALIASNTEKPLFGPAVVNVLKLNIALDALPAAQQ